MDSLMVAEIPGICFPELGPDSIVRMDNRAGFYGVMVSQGSRDTSAVERAKVRIFSGLFLDVLDQRTGCAIRSGRVETGLFQQIPPDKEGEAELESRAIERTDEICSNSPENPGGVYRTPVPC
jgi:hypothetical protein